MNKYTYGMLICVCIVAFIPASAQEKEQRHKLQFDFFSNLGFTSRNTEFIRNDTSKWNDFASSLGCQMSVLGGSFGETQYEMSLRYLTDYSRPNTTRLTMRQLYAQTPLSDFFFLTAGKRENEFGLARYHNFSNRLSPKERLVGEIGLQDRQAPAIGQLDWIVSPHLSVGAFFWATDAKRWKETHLGCQAETEFDNYYLGLFGYYEKLETWSVGFNASRQLDVFRIYSEGIVKQNNPQYFAGALDLKNRDRQQVAVSMGVRFEKGFYSIGAEGAYRTEGYSFSQQRRIAAILIANPAAFQYYNKDYFGKHYIGINASTARLFIPNVGLSAGCLISAGSRRKQTGYEMTIGLGYLHKESVSIGLNAAVYAGGKESEYRMFLPYRYRIFSYLSYSY